MGQAWLSWVRSVAMTPPTVSMPVFLDAMFSASCPVEILWRSVGSSRGMGRSWERSLS